MNSKASDVSEGLTDAELLANLSHYADLCGDARKSNKFRHVTMAIILKAAHDRIATLSPPLPSLEVERLREALEHALDFINGDVGPEFRDFTRDEVTAALSALPLDGGL